MDANVSVKYPITAVYKAFTLVLQAFYGKKAFLHPMSFRFTFYFHPIKASHEIPITRYFASPRIGISLSATGRISPIGSNPG
jgi:hypothetical protein